MAMIVFMPSLLAAETRARWSRFARFVEGLGPGRDEGKNALAVPPGVLAVPFFLLTFGFARVFLFTIRSQGCVSSSPQGHVGLCSTLAFSASAFAFWRMPCTPGLGPRKS